MIVPLPAGTEKSKIFDGISSLLRGISMVCDCHPEDTPLGSLAAATAMTVYRYSAGRCSNISLQE